MPPPSTRLCSACGWMLTLGAFMAIEKNTSWGRRLSVPVGAVLVLAGVLLAVTATPIDNV